MKEESKDKITIIGLFLIGIIISAGLSAGGIILLISMIINLINTQINNGADLLVCIGMIMLLCLGISISVIGIMLLVFVIKFIRTGIHRHLR